MSTPSSHQTQSISSCPSSLISATHNLCVSSRTSQRRQDIQSSYLLDYLCYQRKISCITEKSHKILGKEIWQMRQVELEDALFFLLEEDLWKYVVTAHALSHMCVYTHTHNLLFLRETTTLAFLPQNCWLNTESSTATQHKSACIPPIPELKQEKSSSVCCMSQLYMHVSDYILFLADTKSSCVNYLLGITLLPSSANQQSSAWLAPLFFEQATVLTKVGATPFYWSHSSNISDVLCKIKLSDIQREVFLAFFKTAEHSNIEHLN